MIRRTRPAPFVQPLRRAPAAWPAVLLAAVLALVTLGHASHGHAADAPGKPASCGFCVAFERGAAPPPALPPAALPQPEPRAVARPAQCAAARDRWAVAQPRGPPIRT